MGKSTLLRLIAGQHLLPPHCLRVFGRSPFHDLQGESPTLVDGYFPLHLDLRVSEVLEGPASRDLSRETELIDLLGIDPGWRMHRVSEGQRRRVQLLLALRRPSRLLLLDEVTSQLDVVIRADLLSWLRWRSDELTLLYATHILDGLVDGLVSASREAWPSHLLYLGFERPPLFRPIAEIPELKQTSLLKLCDRWMREELDALRPRRRL